MPPLSSIPFNIDEISCTINYYCLVFIALTRTVIAPLMVEIKTMENIRENVYLCVPVVSVGVKNR